MQRHNALAQACRGSDVRMQTKPRSWRCLEPDGWAGAGKLLDCAQSLEAIAGDAA